MYVTRRVGKILRGLIYKHGTESLKKRAWNWDYSRGSYGYGSSAGDFLYPILVEHAHNGSILDLGRGEGKRENELDQGAYAKCVGVDISDVAIAKARTKAGEVERTYFTVLISRASCPRNGSTSYSFGIRLLPAATQDQDDIGPLLSFSEGRADASSFAFVRVSEGTPR